MPDSAALLETARQLPQEERDALLRALQEDEFAAWQKEAGEAELAYDEWFRASAEEALADTTPGVPHEEAVQEMATLMHAA